MLLSQIEIERLQQAFMAQFNQPPRAMIAQPFVDEQELDYGTDRRNEGQAQVTDLR